MQVLKVKGGTENNGNGHDMEKFFTAKNMESNLLVLKPMQPEILNGIDILWYK
jgi:hypothetical protein